MGHPNDRHDRRTHHDRGWKGTPIVQDARDIMDPKEKSAGFFSMQFTATGVTVILCTVFFALGCFVGRESVWYQLRQAAVEVFSSEPAELAPLDPLAPFTEEELRQLEEMEERFGEAPSDSEWR